MIDNSENHPEPMKEHTN